MPSFRGRTLYHASPDPNDANRAGVCGWSDGVWSAEDFGVTWSDRAAGLPSRRLRASVHEQAVVFVPGVQR